ncbi:hypothetical protein ABUW04_01675 [Streptacidiphilus sp. N1-10]|uniref:PLD phosphodiesterase domain-containing protein n=1 Tax=Streptacidiphilus jeojiensis TaxID=3229225 RepID=A0ABV6XFC0_9ACTN
MRFASPLSLLHEWDDDEPLLEFLLLGFTVDLPFLERVAIPLARSRGSRVCIVGDAAHGLYDPVDVRMAGRGYLHGLASCHGAFHPKVALLLGERTCTVAVGSGNPTLSGWGGNDELWTVVEARDGTSHAVMADLADWLGELSALASVPGNPGKRRSVDLAPWTAAHLAEVADLLTERHISAPPGSDPDTRLLHNLREGFVDQLPREAVDELHLYAPFIDPAGRALRALVERLRPSSVTLAVQPRWTSYDAETVKSALAGCEDVRIRLLDEHRMRHGKLVQWSRGGRWHSLVGSPNLTRAALCASTVGDGNCELAVLAESDESLLPAEGTVTSVTRLTGSTLRPFTAAAHTLVLLGAKIDSAGLHVSLQRAQGTPVVISTSPDGSPGSWTEVGTVPSGQDVWTLAVSEAPGAAVRATRTLPDGGLVHSLPVFVFSTVHCARRDGAGTGEAPRMSYDYTPETLFADALAARRFESDLRRLRELTERPASQSPAASPDSSSLTVAVNAVDHWDAYLAECRRMLGAPLAGLAFGTSLAGLPQVPSASSWTVSAVSGSTGFEADDMVDDSDGETADDTPAVTSRSAPYVPPNLRAQCRTWARRWVAALDVKDGRPAPSLPVVLVVASLYVQLLAAGAWDEYDESWRNDLGHLVLRLTQTGELDEAEDVRPTETWQRCNATVTVLVALLSQDCSFTGGSPWDLVAGRAWSVAKDAVRRARLDGAEDLLLPPDRPLARFASWSEAEGLIALASDRDPYAEVQKEFADVGWTVERRGDLWEVTGSFGNPVPVAAKVADRLGRLDPGCVLVRARHGGRWTFIAWDSPGLVLLNAPTKVWRAYTVKAPATVASRFSGGAVADIPGRVGQPTPTKAGPPPLLQSMLAQVGLDYPDLIRYLMDE